MRVLPILFNTEMVKAILDGRKTVTRRLVRKNDIEKLLNSPFHEQHPEVTDIQIINKLCTPPYQTGDIMYVRETWNICNMDIEDNAITFIYRADKSEEKSARTVKVSDELWDKLERTMSERNSEWRPSLHMPKDAARIFLMVKSVRVERLQDICGRGTPQDHVTNIAREGIQLQAVMENYQKQIDDFKQLWNSTIKKTELEQFGWDANPYVWVIEFARCEKPEGV